MGVKPYVNIVGHLSVAVQTNDLFKELNLVNLIVSYWVNYNVDCRTALGTPLMLNSYPLWGSLYIEIWEFSTKGITQKYLQN